MTRKMIVDEHPEVTVDGMPFRLDVWKYMFDEAVTQLEKIHIDESAYFGVAHFGRAIYGEKDSSIFKKMVKAVEHP